MGSKKKSATVVEVDRTTKQEKGPAAPSLRVKAPKAKAKAKATAEAIDLMQEVLDDHRAHQAELAVPTPAPTPPADQDADARLTVHDLRVRYMDHLQRAGLTMGTRASYDSDLEVAETHFGADAWIVAITPQAFGLFCHCPAVMQKPNGAAKAKPTVDKTRRTFRMALEWAATQGWLKAAPTDGWVRQKKAVAP